MNLSKHLILTILFFTLNTVAFSQQRGNSSQQQGQRNNQTQQKIQPKNMVGIIMYDIDIVLKKIKVKKAPKKAIVSKAISQHNNKINELKTFNYETFDDVTSFLTKKRNEAKLNRDFSTMKEAQMQANEMLSPIRSKVKFQKNKLNTTLEKELSEKQYKAWLKYQQSELKKLNPKAAERPQMQSGQRSRGSGQKQGTGMGRGGY